MSPREPLSAYFEARPSAFHDHFLQSLPRIIGLACSDNFHFLVIFLCPPPSHFFPSICNQYITSPETCRKDRHPSSILNKILVSLFPVLYLSRHLVIFPKMSSCAGWRTCGFTFALVLLYRDSDRPLPHSMSSHFSDRGFLGRRALDCTSIVL
jgi:hypothetical protein